MRTWEQKTGEWIQKIKISEFFWSWRVPEISHAFSQRIIKRKLEKDTNKQITLTD
jgi:hypothetical protein